MDPVSIFRATFAFCWVTYIWETYLSYRQYRIHRDTTQRPAEVSHILTEECFSKARAYKLDKHRFGFVAGLWSQLESSIILLLGLIPWFWNYSGQLTASYGYGPDYEITQSLVFVFLTSVVSTIVSMPWSVYDTFVIEQKHGFNKQTPGFYAKDQVKKLAVSMAMGLPITAVVLWIVRSGGDYFFVYLWVFCSVTLLFFMTIYPEFIAPLFDKYTPLPDGQLRTDIEKLADSLSFPLTKLYVVEGSKRSAHSNAYLYGFWNNKRIVLYDTLVQSYTPILADEEPDKDKEAEGAAERITEHTDLSEDKDDSSEPAKKKKGCSDPEIVAVLGHELGHWKKNHTLSNVVISEVNLFLCFAMFAFLYKRVELYQAFGFHDSEPMIIGFMIIFQFIFAPYNEVLSFLMTALTRMMEFQADAFAGSLGYARLLGAALIKLSEDNLSLPVDDWLYSMYHYSHPPVLERLAALKKFE